jgi:hypothetical protein
MSQTKKGLKKQIVDACIEVQHKKIERFKKAMEDAQNSANSEEKSSAGDKYETARAMSQNERDMNAKHMSEALKDLAVLQQIKPDVQQDQVKLGSLVKTSTGTYLIATSLGEIKVGKDSFFVLSPAAPLIQSMLGMKQGNELKFRDQKITILEVS